MKQLVLKIINLIILIIIIFNYSCVCLADDENEIVENIECIDVLNENVEELKIASKIAVVYDRASDRVIWGKNENKRTAMASTTKIMTAIVAIEQCEDLSKQVKISRKSIMYRWF